LPQKKIWGWLRHCPESEAIAKITDTVDTNIFISEKYTWSRENL